MLPSARVGLEGTAVGPQSDSVNFKIVGGNNQGFPWLLFYFLDFVFYWVTFSSSAQHQSVSGWPK